MDSVAESFVLDPFQPCYLQLGVDELMRRATEAIGQLVDCHVCPRCCGVNRLADISPTCRNGRWARVASVMAHFGEEDCLRGTRGSGTIFFAGCNLHCVFCQNWDISQRAEGSIVTGERLAQMMLGLQQRGCHNVNLVTPEHVVPQVLEGVALAVEEGLRLPIVYNTSGYDSLDSLQLMDGIVDIYMPDFKFWRHETAKRLSKAADYPDRARDAIREMHRQVGDLKMSPDGVARRGLLVRHLVMPGRVDESAEIFRWLAQLSRNTFVNIMGQYRPEHLVGSVDRDGSLRYGEINRRPTTDELAAARQAARQAGLWRFDH